MWLDINYDLLKKWQTVLLTSVTIVFGYNAAVYFHPENQEWIGSDYFSWSHSLKFILIDQILLECITIFILFRLIIAYARVFKLNQLHLSIKGWLKYELSFLPVMLGAFWVFGPFTMTARFLLNHYNDLNWDLYFDSYFYSLNIYAVYLIPVFLFGFGILNVNLLILYNRQLGVTKIDLGRERTRKTKNRIWAADDWGETFLDVDQIRWIERKERKSFASTEKDEYRLKDTITELEEQLDPERFIRINRSTLVNLDFVLNYSFWENDKYVLRMSDEANTEFTMSRERLQKIKHRILKAS